MNLILRFTEDLSETRACDPGMFALHEMADTTGMRLLSEINVCGNDHVLIPWTEAGVTIVYKARLLTPDEYQRDLEKDLARSLYTATLRSKNKKLAVIF